MRAVVDWSYGLLGEDEQQFFRALGIFCGGFTVDAAAAVALDAANDTHTMRSTSLADLVAKSLVVADASGAETAVPAARHDPRLRDREARRERGATNGWRAATPSTTALSSSAPKREAPTRPTAEWLADYVREIDNLRAALDWAFSPSGDRSIGVALTAAAVASVDAPVAARRVPQSRQAGAGRSRDTKRPETRAMT